jgi:hypothetical protein
MMLPAQMMIGTVEADLRNGSSQRRYHGYTTGAHRSDAAKRNIGTAVKDWTQEKRQLSWWIAL